jgi:hypothetical protein
MNGARQHLPSLGLPPAPIGPASRHALAAAAAAAVCVCRCLDCRPAGEQTCRKLYEPNSKHYCQQRLHSCNSWREAAHMSGQRRMVCCPGWCLSACMWRQQMLGRLHLQQPRQCKLLRVSGDGTPSRCCCSDREATVIWLGDGNNCTRLPVASRSHRVKRRQRNAANEAFDSSNSSHNSAVLGVSLVD